MVCFRKFLQKAFWALAPVSNVLFAFGGKKRTHTHRLPLYEQASIMIIIIIIVIIIVLLSFQSIKKRYALKYSKYAIFNF